MRAAGWAWCLAIVVGCRGDDHPAAGDSTGGADSSSGAASESSGSSTTQDASADDSSSTGAPPEVPGDGPFGGGARLQPVVERSGDAMRLLYWYDTELGIECELARDASGEPRCLPIAVPNVTVGFADAGCEQGLVQARSCASAPSWLRTDAPGAAQCDAGTRQLAYRRAAPVDSPEMLWEWDAFFGRCMNAGDVVGDHWGVDRAPDEMFLAAQYVDEPGDSGLMIRAAVFDDGSFERVRLVDAATARPCSSQLALTGNEVVEQCRVDSVGRVGPLFASSDCSGDLLVLVADDGTCDTPALASDGASWWQVGAAFDGTAYWMVDGGCEAYEPGPAESLYTRGSAIEAPTFAPIVYAAVPGDDRLQPIGVEVAGAPLQLTHGTGAAPWYDATLAFECRPVELAEGGRICAHAIEYPHDQTLWGDAECVATPLVRLDTDELPPIVVDVVDDGCRTVADQARGVVGEWTDPIYELDPKTSICALTEREGIRHMQLGSAVQLADLPALTIETLSP